MNRSKTTGISACDDDGSLAASLDHVDSGQETCSFTGTFTISPLNSDDDVDEDPILPRQQNRGPSKIGRHRPHPLNLEKATRMCSPATPTTPSPFLPNRRLGSAERRAQRKPAGRIRNHVNSRDLKIPRNYRAPYVEDSSSDPHSLRGSPLPSILSNGLDGTEELGSHDRNERRKSPSQRKQTPRKDGRHKASSKSPDGSGESEISFDSTRSSSRSSGSKTVRFKSSVDIRSSATLNDRSSSQQEEQSSRIDLKSPRRGNSPLVSPKKSHDSVPSSVYEQERGEKEYLKPPPRFSPIQQDGLGRHSADCRTPSPGTSGAFSKNFGTVNYESERIDTPVESRRQTPDFGSSFGAYFGRNSRASETGLDQDIDGISTPRMSYQRAAGTFSSFYNKPNGSASKISMPATPRLATAETFHPEDHDNKEPARDH